MLAASQRLKRAAEFSAVMRGGARSGSATVVVYLVKTGDATSMAGLAVSRAVGGAVVRNTVKRRLRAITAELFQELPAVSLVVRALPAAASAPFDQLRDDVRFAAQAALRKASS